MNGFMVMMGVTVMCVGCLLPVIPNVGVLAQMLSASLGTVMIAIGILIPSLSEKGSERIET